MNTCVICYNNFSEEFIKTLDCSHFFCLKCLKKLKKNKCPLCRTEFHHFTNEIPKKELKNKINLSASPENTSNLMDVFYKKPKMNRFKKSTKNSKEIFFSNEHSDESRD